MNPQTGLELIQLLDRIDLDQSAALFATLPAYEQQQFCQILWKRAEIQARKEQRAIANKVKVAMDADSKNVISIEQHKRKKRVNKSNSDVATLF